MWIYTAVLIVLPLSISALVCHDYCYSVIGCSVEQNICQGRFCTFYQHRNLARNTQQISIKRGCTNETWMFYGPDQIKFELKNRCIRHVYQDDEWTVALCYNRDYCNFMCDTTIKDTSLTNNPSLLPIFTFLGLLYR